LFPRGDGDHGRNDNTAPADTAYKRLKKALATIWKTIWHKSCYLPFAGVAKCNAAADILFLNCCMHIAFIHWPVASH
jgi:hypothetical protein